MLNWIDRKLDNVTMYRIVLYFLLLLVGVAMILAYFGKLPFTPFALLASTVFLTAACWLANETCAWVFDAPTNVESIYITALILTLIITPASSIHDLGYFGLATWAAIWSMASKYIFAIGKKHLFNPAAFGVALTALTINQTASWWVGTLAMLPFVLVSGLLVTRKIRRFDLVLSFLAVATLAVGIPSSAHGIASLGLAMKQTLVESPLFFFAFVMLTEPLTTPPSRKLRVVYGALTGILFAPWIRIGTLYSTPELALLVSNVFSYLVSPKRKMLLKLKEHVPVADHTNDYVFETERALKFKPGQYLEWTLSHAHPDSRGNRRYFTIASAPTEAGLRLGVKFYPQGSSFKRALADMVPADVIVASQLAGEFVMPADTQEKLAFIAGGIGITPFRSMVKDLTDRGERRSIVLFYSNKTAQEIAYADVFHEARLKLGVKTVFTLTDMPTVPEDWTGRTGFVDEKMIAEEAPDYRERLFYLSGPHAMVTRYQDVLQKMGVPKSRIKVDFFPGFA